MQLTGLGERKMIENLRSFLDIGDDCACIKLGDDFLVMTTDMLYKETHIPDEMSWEQIGKLAVTVNLSDVAAMGAKPIAFLLSYGSPDMPAEFFDEFIRAVDCQCKKYGVKFAGGDINQTRELTLAGTALGITKKPILRSGAGVGDIIAVTGYLGSAALGMAAMESGALPAGKNHLRDAAFEPEPRVNEGILLNNYATAMIDTSDSLALSMHYIAEESAGAVEESTRAVEESTVTVDESTRTVDESTRTVEESTRTMEDSTGAVEESTGDAEESTGENPNANWATDSKESVKDKEHAPEIGIGMELYLDKLPISSDAIKLAGELPKDALNSNLMDFALYGEGDYELLFTVPEAEWDNVKNMIENSGDIKVTLIGRVIEGQGISGILGKERIKIEKRGYEHFSISPD